MVESGFYVITNCFITNRSTRYENEKNLKKGIEYCEKASKMGADICLLPEGFSVNYDLEFVRKIVEKNNKEITTIRM